MRKSWVGSVVAGLLVLAPVAAIAQSGLGDDPEEAEIEEAEIEELVTEVSEEEARDTEIDTLVLIDETETDDGGDGDDPAGESNDHGERVSAVARCAPTGKLDLDGFRNHGAFVRAVAHGDTVTVEGTTYDLSTSEGVEALCAWAATYEPPAEESVEATSEDASGQGRPEDAGPPAHAGPPADAGKPDHAGRPDHAGAASHGGGEGRGKGKGR